VLILNGPPLQFDHELLFKSVFEQKVDATFAHNHLSADQPKALLEYFGVPNQHILEISFVRHQVSILQSKLIWVRLL
jgi:hypothetical protein